MIEYKSREVFKQLIYIITISMAVIGVLFIPQIIFSRVKLSKTIQEKQSIESAKNVLVSDESLDASKKTVSRGDTDVRTATVDQNKEEVKQDNLIEESPLKLTRTFLKAILIMCLITMCSIVLGKTILKGVDYIGSLDVESFRISITMVLVAIDWLYFMYYIEFYSSGQVFRRTELGEQINAFFMD